MDCNRDEALRAKAIAELKFTEKDVEDARKFAIKARNLFPELEGINQMISTLDVYLAGELRINGENNWYAILCVKISEDEETVKKQYRKLALQLHPDKNKSIGAEGAFKLISEAWSVLSDKNRKMVYDQKIYIKKPPYQKRDHSMHNAASGFYNFANNGQSNVKIQKSSTRPPKSSTFWTSCDRCRMQYEYLRVYLNHNLLCPNCHEAFLAVETGFPSNGHDPSASWSAPQQQPQDSSRKSKKNSGYGHGKNPSTVQGQGNTGFHHGADLDANNNLNFQWGAFSRTAGAASASASSSAAAQAANMVHETYEKVRREREEAQAKARRKKNHASKRNISNILNFSVEQPNLTVDKPEKKRRSVGGNAGYSGENNGVLRYKLSSADRFSNFKAGSETGRANGLLKETGKGRATSRRNNLDREFAQVNFRSALIEKAKLAINKKLQEWNSAAVAAQLAEKEKAMQKQKSKGKGSKKAASTPDRNGSGVKKSGNSRNNDKNSPVKKDMSNEPTVGLNNEAIRSISITVPDPDFHDFDKDRTEGAFECDQVWATYDNEDGMPRFYAIVQKILSLKPFKMRMSFLNSKSNSDLGPLNWVASGFTKTCGDFWIGKYKVNDTVNIFSHMIKWEKGIRGAIRILPRKGDTWALYRNWSPDWNERTPDAVIFKYDMVEVLDDYNEEQGVSVSPLVKVAGFRTVFHRHMDPKEVKRIPREEMFRFSHQVPSHLLTGEEAHNAPKGCRELDPAATPLELLQIITEVREDEVMGTAEQQPAS